MYLRVKEAADFLGIAPPTVRKWCNEGKIPHSRNITGQRVFNIEELTTFKNEILGIITEEKTLTIHYARSSNGNDITLQTQLDKLSEKHGEPNKIITDKSSGLNENRPGLKKLITTIKNNHNNETTTIIYVTNKDRLTRFGFTYLEELFMAYNAKIVVLDSDDTKEPHEILMQDFMSLLASFSGKFYRLRGWEQKKMFLQDVKKEVDKHNG